MKYTLIALILSFIMGLILEYILPTPYSIGLAALIGVVFGMVGGLLNVAKKY